MGVADVVERDADGDLYVRLTKGRRDAPLVRLAPGRKEAAAGAPGLGDRLLVRFEALEGGEFEARLIKKLGQSAHRILGVVRKARARSASSRSTGAPEGQPAAPRPRRPGAERRRPGAGPGRRQRRRRYGPKRGKVLEVVGREDDPRAASLIAIHAHGIPTGFSDAAEAEAEAAPSRPPSRAAPTCATCR